MTTEWKELKTLQDVAAAQAAGEEIEWRDLGADWRSWNGATWYVKAEFRSRPKKRTKTIVLREALLASSGTGEITYYTMWATEAYFKNCQTFVRWLDTPAREIEVEE